MDLLIYIGIVFIKLILVLFGIVILGMMAVWLFSLFTSVKTLEQQKKEAESDLALMAGIKNLGWIIAILMLAVQVIHFI